MQTQTLLEAVLPCIFAKMKTIFNISVGKRQRAFLQELFAVVFAVQGRLTFTNMARFSGLHEHTFRRHFARAFDWVAFNLVLVHLRRHPGERLIGVFDTSFLPKSGKKTYGLDKFFSSAAKAIRTGLEVSLLAVIAVESRRAWGLDATQTPPGLATEEPADDGRRDGASRYTRIDFYLEQITDALARLGPVDYFVGDGYYAKRKVFETLARYGKHLVTKLRSDANLRFLAQPYERRSGPRGGRPPRYAGKVRFADFDAVSSRFSEEGCLLDLPHIRIYTAVVNSEHFKRDLRVVVLHNERTDDYAVLCSTDPEQTAEEVVLFYRLRYQIEFVIRDAKQFTGLTHSQARCQEKLDFHLNMSLAAVNVARLVCQRASLSVSSYVREAYNRFLVGRLLSELSLEAEFGLTHPGVARVIQTGRIAA